MDDPRCINIYCNSRSKSHTDIALKSLNKFGKRRQRQIFGSDIITVIPEVAIDFSNIWLIWNHWMLESDITEYSLL